MPEDHNHWSDLSLAQAAEVLAGELPRELDSPDQLPPKWRGDDIWGKYAPAIERWAEITGRPAPSPTDDEGRLNPIFVEWMMDYDEGWVTQAGISRTGQLKALGNAIVPRQAATAWAHLLGLDVATIERERESLLPTPRTSDTNGAGKHGDGGMDLRTAVTCL